MLLFLLTKFAWNPILAGLEKRERGIAETIAATQHANDEAKRMLASYERRLAEAADEVRGMLDEARPDAEATRQSIVAEARRAASTGVRARNVEVMGRTSATGSGANWNTISRPIGATARTRSPRSTVAGEVGKAPPEPFDLTSTSG